MISLSRWMSCFSRLFSESSSSFLALDFLIFLSCLSFLVKSEPYLLNNLTEFSLLLNKILVLALSNLNVEQLVSQSRLQFFPFLYDHEHLSLSLDLQLVFFSVLPLKIVELPLEQPLFFRQLVFHIFHP